MRGTVFDVYVEEQGPVWILLHEGAIQVCNAAGKCRSLDDPCRVLRIGAGGELQDPGTWNEQPAAREVSFERAFPFVVTPPSIDSNPRFTRTDIELGRCPEPKIRKAEEPTIRKVDGGPPKAKRKASKSRQTYARRRKYYPPYLPPSPGISIGIGIGIGGGGGGGGHRGH